MKLLKITAKQFHNALPATPAAPPGPPPDSWPAPPSSDIPVFMEVCRASIDPADFRRVTETFGLAQEPAAELADGIHFGSVAHAQELQLLQVETWLRDQAVNRRPAPLTDAGKAARQADEIYIKNGEHKQPHDQAIKAAREELMLAGDAADTQQATHSDLTAPASHHAHAPGRPTMPTPPPTLPDKKRRELVTRHDLLGLTDPFADPDDNSATEPPVDLCRFHQPAPQTAEPSR